MKILLGFTGSVATTLYKKLTFAFRDAFGDLEIVATQNSLKFIPSEAQEGILEDQDEWKWGNHSVWQKNDPILHIELRKRSSALVIAPCSANKIAEIAHGLCPDLLTSVALAWDTCRPIIVAPAMNVFMWKHPATQENVSILKRRGVIVIEPVNKHLACGDDGVGGMAPIEEIVAVVKEELRWKFPLGNCSGIPINYHPGAFGFHRKYDHHTGVDLYCSDGTPVYALENGRIIVVEHFTGFQGSPWWNNTEAILVEGPSGVLCYGEVFPLHSTHVGQELFKGQHFASVKRVLKEGKERSDIPGHSTSMLHVELYPHGTTTCSKNWELEAHVRPSDLLDPTKLLIDSQDAPKKYLSM
jgi:3-polyprenyl-4-hydroxybenzoate decarboxylase